MHLQQDFQSQGMGLIDQISAFILTRFGGDKQDSGGSAQARQIELVLVHHEFLEENRQRDAARAGLHDEVRTATEVLFVSEDAERRGAVPLVAQRNHGRVALFFNPSL